MPAAFATPTSATRIHQNWYPAPPFPPLDAARHLPGTVADVLSSCQQQQQQQQQLLVQHHVTVAYQHQQQQQPLSQDMTQRKQAAAAAARATTGALERSAAPLRPAAPAPASNTPRASGGAAAAAAAAAAVAAAASASASSAAAVAAAAQARRAMASGRHSVAAVSASTPPTATPRASPLAELVLHRLHAAWSPPSLAAALEPSSSCSTQQKQPSSAEMATAASTAAFLRFVDHTVTTIQRPEELVLVALLLLDRLRGRNPGVRVLGGSEFGMFAVALVLADKTNDDFRYANSVWAQVTGIPLQNINVMEREFLASLEYSLFVSAEEYERHTRLLFADLSQPPLHSAAAAGTADVSATPATDLVGDVVDSPNHAVAAASGAGCCRRVARVIFGVRRLVSRFDAAAATDDAAARVLPAGAPSAAAAGRVTAATADFAAAATAAAAAAATAGRVAGARRRPP
ncbi:hypothetical protein HK405_010405 [Cladochytrium tenue]|nr:hypothetical protein HK405_010405 [Cladochytrium tenue]